MLPISKRPVPITVRFSDFAGVPTVSDGDPLASPRGMAIKFHLPGGIDTDIVAQSYDGFPVRTAEEFLVFVRALAASGPGVPNPKPIANFLASHPQAKRFAEAPKPAPASFATESYYAVNAFRFTNREGAGRDGPLPDSPGGGRRSTWMPLRRPAGRGVFSSTSWRSDSPGACPVPPPRSARRQRRPGR